MTYAVTYATVTSGVIHHAQSRTVTYAVAEDQVMHEQLSQSCMLSYIVIMRAMTYVAITGYNFNQAHYYVCQSHGQRHTPLAECMAKSAHIDPHSDHTNKKRKGKVNQLP